MTDLTKDEAANGWTLETLAAYQRERDKVADVIPGNVVTEFKRAKSPMTLQGARGYNPFTKQHQ